MPFVAPARNGGAPRAPHALYVLALVTALLVLVLFVAPALRLVATSVQSSSASPAGGSVVHMPSEALVRPPRRHVQPTRAGVPYGVAVDEAAGERLALFPHGVRRVRPARHHRPQTSTAEDDATVAPSIEDEPVPVPLASIECDTRAHECYTMATRAELMDALLQFGGNRYETRELLQYEEQKPACDRRPVYTRYNERTHSMDIKCRMGWSLRAYEYDSQTTEATFVRSGTGDATLALPQSIVQACIYCETAQQEIHMLAPGEYAEEYTWFHDEPLGGPSSIPVARSAVPSKRAFADADVETGVQPAFNVFVLLLDSADVIRMPYFMPELYAVIRAAHSGAESADAHEWESFWFTDLRINGRNTVENSMAFLRGCMTDSGCVLHSPFVWEEYRRAGFVTTFVTDVFTNWLDQRDVNKVGGVDYYRRGVSRDTRPNGCNKDFFLHNRKCTGGEPLFEQYAGYVRRVFARHPDRRHFALLHNHETHVGDQDLVASVDASAARLVREMMARGDTAVVVMSDHGLHYTPVHRAPYGRLVHTSPMMALCLPRWVSTEAARHLGIDMRAALRANQPRVVTHFDVFQTFEHWRAISVALGLVRAASGGDMNAEALRHPGALPLPNSLVLWRTSSTGHHIAVPPGDERLEQAAASLAAWVALHGEPLTAESAYVSAQTLCAVISLARAPRAPVGCHFAFLREPVVQTRAFPRSRQARALYRRVQASLDVLGPALDGVGLSWQAVEEVVEFVDPARPLWRGFAAVAYDHERLHSPHDSVHVITWQRDSSGTQVGNTEVITFT